MATGPCVDNPIRLLLVIVLALVVVSLAEGMYFLVRDSGRPDRSRLAKALTARILLSFLVFALLISGSLLGLL
jgi:hypothetical protein